MAIQITNIAASLVTLSSCKHVLTPVATGGSGHLTVKSRGGRDKLLFPVLGILNRLLKQFLASFQGLVIIGIIIGIVIVGDVHQQP